MRSVIVGLALVLTVTMGAFEPAWSTEPAATSRVLTRTDPPAASPVPVLAYYYVWFDPSSWNRAKIDYPTLGKYSSDDPRVLRQHIAWAKSAGIDGFVVSWKHTPTNDRRLRLLMEAARDAHFKLAMIYQGLDFQRHPLPVAKVAADFALFRDQFANDPVFFRLGGKPLTIWSGTWAFSHSDVARTTNAVRRSMVVLSTEKSVKGYQRVADVTDGDAYYWSSVNPYTNKNYAGKLNEMSRAIHQSGKYWIAPFAPGFDARMVGGSKSVERKDGATMRLEYNTAVKSSPDALGLISWNEFSENSYVEPSERNGTRYLDVLRQLLNADVPSSPSAADSSDSAASAQGPPTRTNLPNLLILIGSLGALVIGVGIIARLRGRRGAGTGRAQMSTTTARLHRPSVVPARERVARHRRS